VARRSAVFARRFGFAVRLTPPAAEVGVMLALSFLLMINYDNKKLIADGK